MGSLKEKLAGLMRRTGMKTGDLVIMAAVLLLTVYVLVLTLSVRYVSRSIDPLPGTAAAVPADQGSVIAEQPSEEVTETETAAAEETMEATEETVASGDPAVEKVLADMTLEEKIYQLFIVSPEGLVGNAVDCVTESGNMTKAALQSKPVGGIIYFSRNLQSRQQTTDMITNAQYYAKDSHGIGLWIAVDEEGGKVARVADTLGTTSYSPMATYGKEGDTAKVREIGADIASDIAEYGFNLDFAPVADVDLNSGNELGDRIFSDDPEVVSKMCAAMVGGLQESGQVSATLKHFPGLGAEGGNTHYDTTARIDRTKEQLEAEEFAAFKGGIEAGADFVMVGHQIMSCAGDDLPSDLSPVVVDGWLRQDLGYQGIVVTDSQSMNTVSKTYSAGEAAKKSILAGVDIVLIPTDLEAAYQAVYDAVKSGEIPESRIDESLRRILSAKAKHGLIG
ncbi:MAG: glycoside hydrolase family 3 protein [Oscillospiraceae bacterium]|nr:glycoside hydrolase family 3 protein [Oscillospiraceae bacterium]